jgi:DNA-binding protein H-NS
VNGFSKKSLWSRLWAPENTKISRRLKMEFSIGLVTQVAELMAQEVQEKIVEGTQIAEIEQVLRELSRVVSGLGLQKVVEA